MSESWARTSFCFATATDELGFSTAPARTGAHLSNMVESKETGLRCCYHGWLWDAGGQCREMPAEPADSTLKNRVKTRAYKTQKAAVP